VIGRDRELGTLRDLVVRGDGRLVTLTGLGGVGKTTLALEVVRSLPAQMFQTACMVDLSSTPRAADLDTVATRWVDALGLVDRAGPALEILVAHLAARPALLVVDNCEQVAAAVSTIADRLLDACPYLRLLATSRVRLKVRGESTFVVEPLAVPDAASAAAGDLEAVASVELFITRARAADSDFRLDGVHATSVAAICRRLAGLPLAIELAAAHVHAMSPAEIERQLAPAQGRFASDRRATPARQVTLRATLDWSYELLAPGVQRLFRALSVFADGWTLDAAEAICRAGDGSDTRSGVQRLVEQSLVVREAAGATSRFRFLGPVGEYAALLAAQAGEREALSAAHAQYFLGLAARRDAGASEPTAQQMAAVAAEYPNCLAALQFAEAAGQGPLVLALAGALAFWWRIRGNLHEGLPHLESALALTGPEASRARAVALLVLADVERVLGRLDTAMAHAAEGLAVAETLADPVGRRTALGIQGDVEAARGRFAAAHARYQDAWVFVQAAPHPLAVGYWHANVGHILLREGRVDDAATHLQDALAALAGAEPTWYQGRVYCWLGAVERRRGHLGRARAHLTAGFEQLLIYGDRVDAIAGAEELARVALAESDPTAATTLLGSAAALREAIALPPADAERNDLATDVDRARTALEPADFAAAWARGRALSFDEVITLARTPSAPAAELRRAKKRHRAAPASPLSRREHEVAELIAQGLTNAQIAERLVVSTYTIGSHVEHILSKLGLTSRVQVATWIVDPGRGRSQRAVT